eukprot:TRINITY_DN6741_c0_g1_i3.p1 TRINITY_DN6741_c0_g1~~TRINITY_DN6741_c0_g1_i3.p1  ORF type:complete len:183 (+),score=20.84 TRINITY_DN6741_c0_g1_i3:52-600(+)
MEHKRTISQLFPNARPKVFTGALWQRLRLNRDAKTLRAAKFEGSVERIRDLLNNKNCALKSPQRIYHRTRGYRSSMERRGESPLNSLVCRRERGETMCEVYENKKMNKALSVKRIRIHYHKIIRKTPIKNVVSSGIQTCEGWERRVSEKRTISLRKWRVNSLFEDTFYDSSSLQKIILIKIK